MLKSIEEIKELNNLKNRLAAEYDFINHNNFTNAIRIGMGRAIKRALKRTDKKIESRLNLLSYNLTN